MTSEQKAVLKSKTYSSLLDLAKETGDQGYARAARALWQTSSGGRPAIDDSAALADLEFLLSSGKAKSFSHALSILVRAYASPGAEKTYRERIRAKFKKTSGK